jgi:hypothetical protein
MPMFYGQIMIHEYLTDPAISFCAIGDALTDNAPLQVTQFQQGRDIDNSLSNIYLEGSGGGNMHESYELAAYFYLKHVELKNIEIPFFFVTGDEAYWDHPKTKYIDNVLGVKLTTETLDSKLVWLELMTKYNVFHIKKEYHDEKKAITIRKQWEETIGEERVLTITNPKACVDVVLGAIAITSGARTLEAYLDDMKERGQTDDRIKEVFQALSNYADKLKAKRIQTIKFENGVLVKEHVVEKTNEEKLLELREYYEKLHLNDLTDDRRKIRENLNELKKAFKNEIPDSFYCPISGEIFMDPVITADGHTYERKAIEMWFENHNTSPLTNVHLHSKDLIPNVTLKKLVTNYYESVKNQLNN